MNKNILIVSIIVLSVFLVSIIWGIIGGMNAQDPGVTCDVGVGDTLCWKWHTNVFGEVGEFLKDVGEMVEENSDS